MDDLAKWVGFGAFDVAGRKITVRAEDLALQRVHRTAIIKIAAEKYELGLIEPGDIISVTDADVAQRLG